MRKLGIGMSNEKGFTLIEILVVLLIVSIIIGFALLAYGDFGAKRRTLFAAEQFVNYVKLVQNQAILETGTFGVLVAQNSYQVYRFDHTENWSLIKGNKIHSLHSFPSQVNLTFKPRMETKGVPQIVINESGEMNPFNLLISLKDTVVVTIQGRHNGEMTMELKS